MPFTKRYGPQNYNRLNSMYEDIQKPEFRSKRKKYKREREVIQKRETVMSQEKEKKKKRLIQE